LPVGYSNTFNKAFAFKISKNIDYTLDEPKRKALDLFLSYLNE